MRTAPLALALLAACGPDTASDVQPFDANATEPTYTEPAVLQPTEVLEVREIEEPRALVMGSLGRSDSIDAEPYDVRVTEPAPNVRRVRLEGATDGGRIFMVAVTLPLDGSGWSSALGCEGPNPGAWTFDDMSNDVETIVSQDDRGVRVDFAARFRGEAMAAGFAYLDD